MLELMSQISPEGPEGHCGHQAFSRVQSRIWSSQSASHTAAWLVEASGGFAQRQDKLCRAFVRAVRELA